jgi:hypothetical protein
MNVQRIPIQRRELDAAMRDASDSVIKRAAEAMSVLLDGGTVIVEERIGDLPGGEEMIEETILEAVATSV